MESPKTPIRAGSVPGSPASQSSAEGAPEHLPGQRPPARVLPSPPPPPRSPPGPEAGHVERQHPKTRPRQPGPIGRPSASRPSTPPSPRCRSARRAREFEHRRRRPAAGLGREQNPATASPAAVAKPIRRTPPPPPPPRESRADAPRPRSAAQARRACLTSLLPFLGSSSCQDGTDEPHSIYLPFGRQRSLSNILGADAVFDPAQAFVTHRHGYLSTRPTTSISSAILRR